MYQENFFIITVQSSTKRPFYYSLEDTVRGSFRKHLHGLSKLLDFLNLFYALDPGGMICSLKFCSLKRLFFTKVNI